MGGRIHYGVANILSSTLGTKHSKAGYGRWQENHNSLLGLAGIPSMPTSGDLVPCSPREGRVMEAEPARCLSSSP